VDTVVSFWHARDLHNVVAIVWIGYKYVPACVDADAAWDKRFDSLARNVTHKVLADRSEQSAMSSWCQVAPKRKEKLGRDVAYEQRKPLTKVQLEDLLSRFKTTECDNETHHDPRICTQYHDIIKERRRNPFKEYYTVDECVNTMEKMYHPVLFRTHFCRHGSACPFQSICAHAHSPEDLRDRALAEKDHDQFPPSEVVRQRPRLAAFMPEIKQRDFKSECGALWSEIQLQTSSAFVELNESQCVLIDRCESLFYEIQEFAFEEGLGCVTKRCNVGRQGLFVKGLHVESIISGVEEMLQPPSKYCALEECHYSGRVVDSIGELIRTGEGRRSITSSENALIQVVEQESKVLVYGVHSRGVSGADVVRDVIGRIAFWINQEGYGTFAQCGCCFEKRNFDEGLACSEDHFYCSVGEQSCFATLITAQINQIRSSDTGLACPECCAPYDTKDVASHLPSSVWDQVQDAIVAKKVEKESEVLARRFDERLEAKIQELMSSYGNANAFLKERAQEQALKAKNTIMNLCCPHCKIAYADFAGCMALQCQTCKGHFCRYCHQASATGRGTHEHVRQCLMNETNNGSYYATEEEVKRAQRRYKTREIKKFLQKQGKKDLQNAIVIELAQDLHDVGVQPDAHDDFAADGNEC
jgi:hypothetical protein